MHDKDESMPSNKDETANSSEQQTAEKEVAQKLSILHVITSVFAAAIGVQSKKNQQKDFSNKQSIYIYIAAGVLFTTAFVFAVIYVVKIVLHNAGV